MLSEEELSAWVIQVVSILHNTRINGSYTQKCSYLYSYKAEFDKGSMDRNKK